MKILYYLFLTASAITTAFGLIQSFHCTQLEALVYNWQYWVLSLIFGLIATIIHYKMEK